MSRTHFILPGIALNTAASSSPDRDPWADAIAEASAHVRAGSEHPPDRDGGEPTRGRKLLWVAAGMVVAASVAVGVREVARPEPAGLSMASQAADLRREASALIEQIEAYRAERGQLPDPSLLAPFLDEGYEYEIVDGAAGEYLVRRTAGGVTVTYDGSVPLGMWLLIGGGTTGSSP